MDVILQISNQKQFIPNLYGPLQCSALDDLLQNISTSASNVATTSDTCVSVSVQSKQKLQTYIFLKICIAQDPSSSHGKRRGNAVAAIVASVVSILLLLVVGIILAWVRHKRRSYEGDGKDIPIPVMATNPSIQVFPPTYVYLLYELPALYQINEDDEDGKRAFSFSLSCYLPLLCSLQILNIHHYHSTRFIQRKTVNLT